jgi:hypothetical protein
VCTHATGQHARMRVATFAAQMLEQCIADGQSARRVSTSGDADVLRHALRQAARDQHVRIRTAYIDDAVVVVRTDADLWNDDAATMRAKLTPPA